MHTAGFSALENRAKIKLKPVNQLELELEHLNLVNLASNSATMIYVFSVMVQEVWFKACGSGAAVQEPWFRRCGLEVRQFIKGTYGFSRSFVECLCGSPNLYQTDSIKGELYIAFNTSHLPVTITLPERPGYRWEPLVDTRKAVSCHPYFVVFLLHDTNANVCLVPPPTHHGDPDDPYVLLKRDCVAIMVAFKFKEPYEHYVIVVNSHIYWDPKWADVKLTQATLLWSRLRCFGAGYVALAHFTNKKLESCKEDVKDFYDFD
ncbi:DNAse I-like superfamily protein [Tanacetum coccineum]